MFLCKFQLIRVNKYIWICCLFITRVTPKHEGGMVGVAATSGGWRGVAWLVGVRTTVLCRVSLTHGWGVDGWSRSTLLSSPSYFKTRTRQRDKNTDSELLLSFLHYSVDKLHRPGPDSDSYIFTGIQSVKCRFEQARPELLTGTTGASKYNGL